MTTSFWGQIVTNQTALSERIMDGTKTAAAVREELSGEVKSYVDKGLRAPGLAVILIGDDPASHVYVKNKISACAKAGIASFPHELPASTDAATVFALIKKLNQDDKVDGILVQLPLPKHLPTEEILNSVLPEKDADGLHPLNMGYLFCGKPGLRPCTPSGIIKLLDHYKVQIAGKNAVVIGRSNLVGKPIALMLMERNATVTICHSRSENLNKITRGADILVVAAGKQGMIGGNDIKDGAVVIDVGIHKVPGPEGKFRLVGDVLYEEAAAKASLITPVPGGIGPMTIAMLLCNTVESYKKRLRLS